MLDNNPVWTAKLTQSVQSSDPIGASANGSISANGVVSSLGVVGIYKADTFYLDSAPNHVYDHQKNYNPASEEVKEVQTEAAGYDSTIGDTIGAQLNMVSKNGTITMDRLVWSTRIFAGNL